MTHTSKLPTGWPRESDWMSPRTCSRPTPFHAGTQARPCDRCQYSPGSLKSSSAQSYGVGEYRQLSAGRNSGKNRSGSLWRPQSLGSKAHPLRQIDPCLGLRRAIPPECCAHWSLEAQLRQRLQFRTAELERFHPLWAAGSAPFIASHIARITRNARSSELSTTRRELRPWESHHLSRMRRPLIHTNRETHPKTCHVLDSLHFVTYFLSRWRRT